MHNKKLKVLFYTYPSLWFNTGGLQNQILNTKKALEIRGHQVIFFNDWIKSKDEVEIDICHQFSTHFTLYNMFKELKKRNYKIIISTVYNKSNNLSYKLLFALSKFKLPVLYFKSLREMIENSDALISLGNKETVFLTKKYKIKHKIHNVFNGILDSILKVDLINNVNKNKSYIVTVGGINKNKNQLSLIKACEKLKLDLFIIGPIVDSDYFDECKKNSNSKTHFMGYLKNESEDFINIVKNASLFVLPSKNEVLPISIFESLALGTPVVGTKNSNVSTYLSVKHGYLECNPNSINDIVKKIKKGLCLNISNENIQLIRDEYKWDSVAEQIEKIYYETLNVKI